MTLIPFPLHAAEPPMAWTDKRYAYFPCLLA